jgi:alpha-galactosidase
MMDQSALVAESPLIHTECQSHQLSHHALWMRRLVVCLAWMLALAFAASAQELSNDCLTLRLGVSHEGIPIIKEAVWKDTGQAAFRDAGTPDGLRAWVPTALIPGDASEAPAWIINEDEQMFTAEATRPLAAKMRITWILDLPKQGPLFRLRVRLTGGKQARDVEWFPAWSANWQIGGGAQWVRWWRALEFDRKERALDTGSPITLSSRLNSSDDGDNGVNPYWVVGGQSSRIYFSLQWSGGWRAQLNGLDNGLAFAVNLPPAETQLTLNKRKEIEGPALLVTLIEGTDEAEGRAQWMRQRRALGEILYGGPGPSFPLTYNHWYAIRKDFNADFLARQLAAMSPYEFDAFVIDAGWFANGRWKPDPVKFPSGELTDALAWMKTAGIKPGLWSTPQFVSKGDDASALTFEDPAVFSNFIDGYLVDLSQPSYTSHLLDHVTTLRNKYSMDYWKYDQLLFSDQTHDGEMKNVIGFQTALQSVRQAHPDLTIENCLNGGRILNDFTLLLTQTSWLSDYGKTSDGVSQVNIHSGLYALEMVFPWSALRFSVNFDQSDPNDDEQTRLSCRSAMMGTWGLSTDLSLISARQQPIILKEIANYRRLSRLKYSCLYDLYLPSETADAAGVTYYSPKRHYAGILLYRWQRNGAFNQPVGLAKLRPEVTYSITDVDTGAVITARGSDLIANGVSVSFSGERQSALLFIEPARATPAQ